MTPLAAIRELKQRIADLEQDNLKLRLIIAILKSKEQPRA